MVDGSPASAHADLGTRRIDAAVGSAVPAGYGYGNPQHFEHWQLREWSSTEPMQVGASMRYRTMGEMKKEHFWEEEKDGNRAFAIEFKPDAFDRKHHYRVYVRPADTANSYEVGRCSQDGTWFLLPDRKGFVRPYQEWLEKAMGRLSDMTQVHGVMDS